eukprot:CAMPEP_0198118632 /NCGR_PEP_ID=MMETSP1442-20131203/22525_1 /TAXON_ID= /ORGANISM="Craspedostauros australis, Strain CCMP3328" /LENGTH=54 /DNA_ID=CAMNT_0043776931 /DNA_START=74 /DNA_END=235 /DNA_ORIENTATION=-
MNVIVGLVDVIAGDAVAVVAVPAASAAIAIVHAAVFAFCSRIPSGLVFGLEEKV